MVRLRPLTLLLPLLTLPAILALAQPVTGTVTCNGTPVYHALVQALADPTAKAPLGETYSDAAGRFTLDAKSGALVVTARRSIRLPTGALLPLTARALPVGPTVALQLDQSEVQSRNVAATRADLANCPLAAAPKQWQAVAAAVEAVIAADPAQQLAVARQQQADLRQQAPDAATQALEAQFKTAEMARDLPRVTRIGTAAVAVAAAIGEPELAAVGTVWQAVAFLYGGRLDQALPLLHSAIDQQAAIVRSETRPGWLASRRKLHAVLLQLGSLLAASQKQHELALTWRQTEAALRAQADQPDEAAAAWQFAGEQAVAAGQAHVKAGRLADALQAFGVAVATLDKLPASEARDKQLWLALGALGRGAVLRDLGRLAEAVADLKRAIALQPKTLPPKSRGLDWQVLGYALQDLGELAPARDALLTSAGLWRQSEDPKDLLLSFTMVDHAAMTYLDAEPADSLAVLALLEPAIAQAEALHLPAAVARLQETCGHACFWDWQRHPALLEQGQLWLQRAEQGFASLGDADAVQRIARHAASLQRIRAVALAQAGKPVQAEQALRAAIAAMVGQNRLAEASNARDALAMLLFEQLRFAEAAALWQDHCTWLQTPEAATDAQQTLATLGHPTAQTRAALHPLRLQATCWALLATAWQNAGEPQKTLQARRDQRVLLVQLADGDGVAAVDRELALGAVLSGDAATFSTAVAQLRAAAKTTDALASVEAIAALRSIVGSDEAARNRDVAALAAFLRQHKAEAEKLPAAQRRGFVQAWALLGAVLSRTGDPQPAIDALQLAAAWAEPAARAAMLHQLAHLYRLVGRLQAALDTYRKAQQLQHETAMFTKPAQELLGVLQVVEIQRALGDVAGAAVSLQQAIALGNQVLAQPTQQADDRRAIADLHTVLARQALVGGQAEVAQQAAEKALGLYTPQQQDETTALAGVVAVAARHLQAVAARIAALKRAGVPSQSEDQFAAQQGRTQQHLRTALDNAVKLHATEAAMLGSAFVADDPVTHAPPRFCTALVQAAHDQALALGRLTELAGLSWLLARHAVARKEPEVAVGLYRQAIDETEIVRSSLASDQTKVALHESNDGPLYGALEALLLQLGRDTDALEIAEMRRGRALLDALATTELRDATSATLRTTAEAMRALARQDELLDFAFDSGTVEKIDPTTGRAVHVVATRPKLALRLADSKRQVEALWQNLAQTRRQAAQSQGELASLVTAPLVTFAEIARIATTHRATLVLWSVAPDRLVAYVVQPTGTLAVRTTAIGEDQLTQLVHAVRHSVHAEIGREFARGADVFGLPDIATASDDGPLKALHAALFAPIADLLPADPDAAVVVVPHRALLLAPLAALLGPDGQPELQRHALSVVPSLGVLRYTAAKAQRASKSGALVVGNPAMPVWQGSPLPQLPGAQAEALAVAQAIGAGAGLLTGPAATESAVRAAGAGKRILHLASHGVLRDDDAGLSFVALAAGGGQDGLLTVGEVLQWKLTADLVVLSACQTGLGKVSGDGVMGLGRAFLFAGTPRVVTSLWSVPDAPTALLMAAFYRQLATGSNAAVALRIAQLATRASYPAPENWAAFELIGQGW